MCGHHHPIFIILQSPKTTTPCRARLCSLVVEHGPSIYLSRQSIHQPGYTAAAICVCLWTYFSRANARTPLQSRCLSSAPVSVTGLREMDAFSVESRQQAKKVVLVALAAALVRELEVLEHPLHLLPDEEGHAGLLALALGLGHLAARVLELAEERRRVVAVAVAVAGPVVDVHDAAPLVLRPRNIRLRLVAGAGPNVLVELHLVVVVLVHDPVVHGNVVLGAEQAVVALEQREDFLVAEPRSSQCLISSVEAYAEHAVPLGAGSVAVIAI
ncbi:hypothetical protein GGR56DRAFT_652323 [Xylariaceae sp. FL0804]|nr:hypothetical protein GGR56DRAFT_652323 [Xylariaceae sp. FL0804]